LVGRQPLVSSVSRQGLGQAVAAIAGRLSLLIFVAGSPADCYESFFSFMSFTFIADGSNRLRGNRRAFAPIDMRFLRGSHEAAIGKNFGR